MKLTPLSATPIVGTRRGQVYTAPGATNIARARVVPLQPKSNPQATIAQSVANLAQLWRGLTLSQQMGWTDSLGTLGDAYKFFVQYNTPLLQWGIQYFTVWPGIVIGNAPAVMNIYAEPDGQHTTLVTTIDVPIPPPDLYYLELYVRLASYGSTAGGKPSLYTYLGAYGPAFTAVHNYFDLTPAWAQAFGQWLPPGTVDTTRRITCGVACDAQYYIRNARGAHTYTASGGPFTYPTIGLTPARLGAGLCPILGPPPYPWPPSH